MEDSGYRSCDPSEFPMCALSGSAHNIFSIKYSDLAASKYSGLLLGFQNEQDFEDFKQDLIDFQKLKKACCGDVVAGCDDDNSLLELEAELQFIQRPNNVCKERRKGHMIRRLNQLYQSPGSQCGLDVRSLQKAGVSACGGLNKQCPDNVNGLKDCPEQTPRPAHTEKRNSFDLRPDFDRRSGLFGFDRNCALRSSIHTILMEFLSGDEHFREFERVFETVNNRKDNANTNLNVSSERNRRLNALSNSQVSSSTEVQQSPPGVGSDIFSDFFDNDETFLEFEKEFEKFRSSRKSNLLGSLNSMGSSRDIFGDMKSYCERNIKCKSGSHVSVNSFSFHDEATPICGDDAVHHELIWHSVEDWAKVLRKMKRNSRLMLETCCPKHKPQYRHSISVQSRDGVVIDAYNKTQSLADLRRCDSDALHHSQFYSSPYNRGRASQSDADLIQINSLPNSPSKQSTHADCALDKSFQSINFSSDSEDSSDHWSETYDNDNRYSSSSTLCSGDGDICSSFSCSCCSDLHVEEDTDDDILSGDRSPPLRARSHSLMEFSKNTRPDNLGLYSVSMDNLINCNQENKAAKSRLNSHCGAPSPRKAKSSSSNCNLPYLDDDTPTDDDESIVGSSSWSRPPSTVSAQLSDAESEQYHSAASDLSDQYSTAKSDLSYFARGFGLESTSRSLSPDLPDGSTTNDDHRQSITRGLYHSYHGREGRAKYRHDRPRSGSACQYTCHQQCLPAVTLNCKSISDDGSEVSASRTPSPSDPPPHKETSLSVGKPGCARTASGQSSSTTNTVTPRVSESAPDFHIVQESNGAVDSGSCVVHSDLIYDYFDTPKVSRLPSHHLSRSASEGFFAGNTSHAPHMNKRSSLTPQTSQGHNTSSPQCTTVHTDRLSGSSQEANIQTHLPRGTLLKNAESNGKLQERTADSGTVIQGNANVTACNNTNNTSQNIESSDDKLLDLPHLDANQEATSERDETDSGYRSGTIPDDKLPRVPSQATLDREALSRTIAKYNHFVPAAGLDMTGKESFQGFVKVTMNLIRPITMELGARPPSIYELLTREHIIEENTQQVAFYMPRDTHKSLHITSETTTKEVVTSLLKKFHILDHPRKFAMYEQEFSDSNKLVRLRRLTDKDFPLRAILNWDPERITNYRMVLQENETGEIVWDVFSLPELGNFLKVLDREEKETILELKHKYAYMKQYMERRLAELRNERNKQTKC